MGQPDSQAKGDDNNGIDDEDGVQIPRMIFAGEKAILLVDVVNATGLPAYVYGFIDWDNSGTLGDIESEISFLQLAPGNHEDVMLMFKTPDETIIPLNQPLAARFRIGTVQDQVSTPKGFAENGEVEDYFVNVKGVDFGDLPDIQDGVSGGDYSTMKDNTDPDTVFLLLPLFSWVVSRIPNQMDWKTFWLGSTALPVMMLMV
jgi:hypothetical protein